MKINSKIFAAILLAVLLTSAINYFIFVSEINPVAKTEAIRSQVEIETSGRIFYDISKENTRAITTALTVFTQDNSFKEKYMGGNREELYEKSLPLFDELKKNYGITHFYFIKPDGTIFLRVHNQGKYGDVVERATFKQAKEKNNISSGMDLGPLMFFTLRVVAPYYNNNELIGYVEFGKEIDDVIKNFKVIEGDDIILFVNKKHIDKEKWASAKAGQGIRNSWEDISDYVIVGTTMKNEELTPEHIKAHKKTCFASERLKEIEEKENVTFIGKFKEDDGDIDFCGGESLYDAENKKIGVILSHHDISSIESVAQQTKQIIFLSTMGIGIIIAIISFFIVTYLISKPIEKITKTIDDISMGKTDTEITPELKKRDDEIGDLARAFDRTLVSLKLAMKKSGIRQESRPEEKGVTAEDLAKEGLINIKKSTTDKIKDKGSKIS